MKIIHFMGMKSLKFGALERFMLTLKKQDVENEHILVYKSQPQNDQFRDSIGKIYIIDNTGFNVIKKIPNLIHLLKKENPQIIHFHFDTNFALWSRIIKIYNNKIKIYKTAHSCIYINNTHVTSLNQFPLRHRILTFGKNAYKYIDKIFAVSNFVKNQLDTIYKEINTETIYLGIEQPKIDKTKEEIKRSLNISQKDIIVATTLFASPIKGADLLIEAFSKIKNKNVKLMIIGLNPQNPYSTYLMDLVKKYDLGDKVINVGLTNSVTDFLMAADIYVQPSRTEALSLAAVEAAALSLPIIGSNTGGLPEVANIIYETINTSMLANLIDNLIIDKKRRLDLGLEAKSNFENNFNINRSINKYINVYKTNNS